jgi:hypothetical protein
VGLFYFDLNLKLYLKRFEKKQKKKNNLPSWPEGRRTACSPASARVGRPALSRPGPAAEPSSQASRASRAPLPFFSR